MIAVFTYLCLLYEAAPPLPHDDHGQSPMPIYQPLSLVPGLLSQRSQTNEVVVKIFDLL